MDADFPAAFAALTGSPPFRWQVRLFRDWLLRGRIPAAIDLPTGLGKTSVMAIWYLALRAGAPLPRRLVYVVDRRAVVDQATTVAEAIKAGASTHVHVSTLRGQFADNRDWLADPAAPAIVVGTVDMIGSRLLFSGYGVSRRMRPYQAGLLGADTLLVLDESHLVPPFQRLLESIAEHHALAPDGAAERAIVPPFRLLALSATGKAGTGPAFTLDEDDRLDDIVAQRLTARKRACLLARDSRKLETALAEAAWSLTRDADRPVRCLVYCNSREVALSVRDALAKLGRGTVDTELFVGARRVRERELAADWLRAHGFLAGSPPAKRHAFVVATSAGEVGVDLNADHMVCDLVPWERMVQRLGRVNRRGDGDARVVVVHDDDAPAPGDDRAARSWRTLQLVQSLPADDVGYDVSPAALATLRETSPEAVAAASSEEPRHPALTRALVEAWSMTSLAEHTGRPEVAPWLRGWVDDPPRTTLAWRTHLPVRIDAEPATDAEVEAFFDAAPVHLSERLETETWRTVEWLMARALRVDEAARTAVPASGEDRPPPLGAISVAALALDDAGYPVRRYRLRDLLPGDVPKRRRQALERELAGVTLILDARFGGLAASGMLDAAAPDATTADGDPQWRAEVDVGFSISVMSAADDDERRGRKPHYFALEHDEDGEVLRWLVIEKPPGESKSEDERALSSRPQRLDEHQLWTAERMRCLAANLKLPTALADALTIAARLHDEGKRARRWQRAFNAPADAAYAKTRGPVRIDLLGGYRHELGSLLRVKSDAAFRELPADMQDLVRHLIAAHHGRARPTIGTSGCDEAPPSALARHARDAALRFVRLQHRWGPWGLAWLEALLRAADQQASRANDLGGDADG